MALEMLGIQLKSSDSVLSASYYAFPLTIQFGNRYAFPLASQFGIATLFQIFYLGMSTPRLLSIKFCV